MKAISIGCNAVNFDDGTCWPRMYPCGDHGVAWQMRYGGLKSVLAGRYMAASVMDAYSTLLGKPHRRLLEVVKALRQVERDIDTGAAECAQCKLEQKRNRSAP